MEQFTLYIPCEKHHCYGRGLQKFYAVLDRPIGLNGYWEVGLAEISFSKSFYNIKEDQSVDLVFPQTDSSTNEIMRIYKSNMKLEAGEYSIVQIVDKMNEIIRKQFENNNHYRDGSDDVKIDRNKLPEVILQNGNIVFKSGQVRQHKNNQLFFIYPSEYLCENLGFDRNEIWIDYSVICSRYKNSGERATSEEIEEIFNNNLLINSKYPHKIYDRKNHFFVCSDINETMQYGEMKQPILRHVNFDNVETGSKVLQIYDKPYYFKVKKSPFQMIEIRLMENLNNHTDTEIQESEFDFRFGEIYLVLHFRKVIDKKTVYDLEMIKEENDSVELKQRGEDFDPFEVLIFDPETEEPPETPINP